LKGSQNWLFLPNIRVLLGGKAKNTDIVDLRGFLMKNHDVLRTGNMDEQSNYDSGETEKCLRNHSEN
ncbi:MAG: hypothetical protein ABJC87_04775, partial [Roseobacter sp.]